MSLHAQRSKLESEAIALTEELLSGDPPMGVDTPLVDAEGYPLSTIDVHTALILRNRLSTIRTDHSALMAVLEPKLQAQLQLGDPAAKRAAEEEAETRARPKPRPKYDNVTGKWVVCNSDGTVSGIEGGGGILFKDIGDPEVDKVRLAALAASAAATSPAPAPAPSSSSSSKVPSPLAAAACAPLAACASLACCRCCRAARLLQLAQGRLSLASRACSRACSRGKGRGGGGR
jgi:hypothetical protein